jgi:hypothetical protein
MNRTGIQEITNEIRRISYEIRSARTDGWTGWHLKQQLMELHMFLESEIAKCPKYTPESEWLANRMTELAFEKLSGENS